MSDTEFRMRTIAPLLIALLALCTGTAVFAGTTAADLKAEIEQLRKEMEKKEKEKAIGSIDTRVASRFGPDAEAVIKHPQDDTFKLEIQGLVQVWYQSVQNDQRGVTTEATSFNPQPQIAPEVNDGNDNDTFRIRRTELRAFIDITPNVVGFVMIDPARQHNPSFYPVPTLPRHNTLSGNFANLQTGQITDGIPRLLQDAYISFIDVVPHHYFTVGQFKPPAGEEAWRNTAQLDFVERSMVTGINNVRDMGAMVSGFWLQNRVTYAFGLFNGPSGTVLSDPEIVEAGNRSDDNDAKDFAWRITARPVWSTTKWYGRLEVGTHRTDGVHGEGGQEFDPDFATNSLNIKRTNISRQGAWAWYRPNGPVLGWWMRGEWGESHDRYGQGALTSLLGIGSVDLGQNGPRGGNGFTQGNPSPVNVEGWYFATGYRIADGIFADKLATGGWASRALNNMEFAFRYETYENVAMEDLVESDRHTDQFKTQAVTLGLTYFMKTGSRRHDAKIQANYVFVDDPSSNNELRGLREVHNDVFVVNFQVSF
jgi:hypothetical protein